MLNMNLSAASLKDQFQDLGGRHPGQWPILPRLLCGLGVVVAVSVAGYFAYWSSQWETQDAGAAQEQRLRDEYKNKIAQVINLDALRAQKVEVDKYIDKLQKQLPSKAEMAALLSDINQAGQGRGLQFELFKPGNVAIKDYYAELPIEIRVTGNYHDIGAFASDMANLPRIVTLNNMALTAGKDGKDAKDAKSGTLTLDAVAKTFRYLDTDELAAQRAEMMGKKKGKAAKQ
jgi:type IV pilus assembly protein PilO